MSLMVYITVLKVVNANSESSRARKKRVLLHCLAPYQFTV